ncbi:alpha/beta-Hydrolases superfamily protein [Thalictrum thalictroides]|uniref:Alpha/beta-Hydrolases superfamily protein n=1 Tax=Thalictrum thalictroides TaxID=46969 RepID=A0A7J6UTA4_THATH|nr:alpha/beta-Hydrolases superfamily protein [Thalictrum thalictroides]
MVCWTLFISPSLSLLPNSSSSTTATSRRISRRSAATFLASSDTNNSKDGKKKKDKDNNAPAFNPFGFVTDNPSSRSAIQITETPAEAGNVGQMLNRIEDKGRDYGSTIKSGKLRWFVRETGTSKSRRGTVVFLHGAPTQSYSYRVVMAQMADAGFHCFAPDWIGFGFSDKPQPGYGFDYTEEEFHVEFDKLLQVLGVESPFFLVVQGFLVGSYGLTWALKNSTRISKLAILNSPLTVASPIPGLFQQLRIPLFGEFTCQNAVMAERFIEAGSAYVLKLEKADVYRLPYLASSGPGFALLETARKANFKDISSRIATGFSSGRWDRPILLAWGLSDKYLPQSVAEEFQKGNPSAVDLKLIEGAGHMPQEDWPEKVVNALRRFL